MPVPEEIAKETSHMDRITQLQDATDELVTIMFSSIDYLTRKATFKQVVPSIPVTQEIPNSEKPEVFEAQKKEMVENLLIKAKQIEYLINALPAATEMRKPSSKTHATVEKEESERTRQDKGADSINEDEDDDDGDFAKLENEMEQVNEEYLTVLRRAEELQDQLKATIRNMLEEHSMLSKDLLLH